VCDGQQQRCTGTWVLVRRVYDGQHNTKECCTPQYTVAPTAHVVVPICSVTLFYYDMLRCVWRAAGRDQCTAGVCDGNQIVYLGCLTGSKSRFRVIRAACRPGPGHSMVLPSADSMRRMAISIVLSLPSSDGFTCVRQ
jgi:hypothetical protein